MDNNIQVGEIEFEVLKAATALSYGVDSQVLIERSIPKFGERIAKWIVKCAGIVI